jgi:hypothetical protein
LNDNQLVSGGKGKEQRPQDQHVSDPANFALFVTQFCESIQRLPAVYLARPLTKDDADAVEKLRGTVSQLSSAVSLFFLYVQEVEMKKSLDVLVTE